MMKRMRSKSRCSVLTKTAKTAMLAMLVVATVMVTASLPFLVADAAAQSSSLFMASPAGGQNGQNGSYAPVPMREDRLSPHIAALSIAAIEVPPPRVFALHDLVTIIVREETEAGADATLETDKKFDMNGSVPQFPNLALEKLLKFIIEPAVIDADNAPGVEIGFDTGFEGEGSYERKDSFTARITAEVVDVKPNGNIVLEARKFIRSDKETLEMVLTGVCRVDDVAADNTVLSTLLFDLRLEKDHTGELRKATKKGWLTKLFEGIFNF